MKSLYWSEKRSWDVVINHIWYYSVAPRNMLPKTSQVSPSWEGSTPVVVNPSEASSALSTSRTRSTSRDRRPQHRLRRLLRLSVPPPVRASRSKARSPPPIRRTRLRRPSRPSASRPRGRPASRLARELSSPALEDLRLLQRFCLREFWPVIWTIGVLTPS